MQCDDKETAALVFESPFQLSTVTSKDRHKFLIQQCAKLLSNTPENILSFGCSSGFEVETLCELFPDAKTITGVDISKEALAEANIRLTLEPRARFWHSSEFARNTHQKYDLITAFNVLCNYHGTGKWTGEPLPFKTFQQAVTMLVNNLSPNGVLMVYGANYSVEDVGLDGIILQNLKIDSGPVPLYQPDGCTLITRSNQHTFAIQKVLYNATDNVHMHYHDTNEVKHEEEEREGKQQCLPSLLQQTPILKIKQRRPIFTVGLMRPGNASSNIGDFIQTLAQVNVWSVFYCPSTWTCSAAIHRVFAHFSKTKPRGSNVRQQHLPCDVRVVWVDRDCSTTTSGAEIVPGEKIHVIANGWYMHADPVTGTFNFPFAEHIVPVFVSMHIAHPQLLDAANVVAYLQKHSPIGCRDTATVELMKCKGIDAYFSACLTATLESGLLFAGSTNNNEECNERTTTTTYNNEHLNVDALSTSVAHYVGGPLMSRMSPDMALELALAHLQRYSHAHSITSSRIHCLIPAAAVCKDDTELTFCSRTGGQEGAWLHRSRFSGLKNTMQDPLTREIMALILFESLVEQISQLLFSGIRTSKCSDRETLDLTAYTDMAQRPRELRTRHPAALRVSRQRMPYLICALQTVTTTSKRVLFDNETFILRKCPFQAFPGGYMDILVTFDAGYVDVVPTFLKHLSMSNPNFLLRVWCATRGISTMPFKKTPANVVLHHFPLDDQVEFADYRSPLTHVSNVCMDRILVEKLDFGVVHVERILYLDLDMAVVGSLEELLHIDTGLTGIAAKTSKVSDVINGWLNRYNLQKPLEYTYGKSFNAGVLVMDLSKLQRNGMYNFCRKMYDEYGVNDQVCLNFYCAGQYRELPGRFNIFVGQDHTNFTDICGLPNTAAIYHFVGSKKPWLAPNAASYVNGPRLWDMWHKHKLCKKLQHIPGAKKFMLCKNFKRGYCSYGTRCKFLHQQQELFSIEDFFSKSDNNGMWNSKLCVNAVKQNRCVLTTCDQKPNDIQPLMSKSQWSCHMPTSFQIISGGHNGNEVQFQIWTLDTNVFYLNVALTSSITSIDLICRHYPPANDGIKELIHRFQSREAQLDKLYEKVNGLLSFLPKSLVVLIIDAYLNETPNWVIHWAQPDTFNYALKFKMLPSKSICDGSI